MSLDSRLSLDTFSTWTMPPPCPSVEWVPANIIIPAETETPGPFDLQRFPHCEGVLEAWDDTQIRSILMPWAARLGKTILGMSLLMHAGVNTPRPMMVARENEDRITDMIESQFYPLLEACDATRSQLKPEFRRNKRAIELANCRIRRVYSGSPSTMGGFPACNGLASEVSKWQKKKSTEADPIYLFKKRGMLFPFDSKFIFESTPSLEGDCNITELCSAGGVDVRRRMVPCPHCGTFQELTFGSADSNSPGVKWKKDRSGLSDTIRAESTAWYRCENGCRVDDWDRPKMMRGGLWISNGQGFTKRNRLKGKPSVEGASTVAFGHPITAPFSSLHSLMISGWGQIAREFLEVRTSREGLREFNNQSLGLTWSPIPVTATPHELAERMCVGGPSDECPEWAKFVTVGVDVQDQGDTFVWVACAWGDGGRGQEIAHGIAFGDVDLTGILRHKWPHEDGGRALTMAQALIDSGFATEMVYDLCRRHSKALPCKGMGRAFDTEYRLKTLTADKRRSRVARGAVELVEINTDWTQKSLQRYLDGRTTKHDPPFELADDTGLDIEFLDELLNEQRIEDVDAKGYPVSNWVRRNHHQPNDFRDALRYARTAASLVTQQGRRWNNLPKRKTDKEKKQVAVRTGPVTPPWVADRGNNWLNRG